MRILVVAFSFYNKVGDFYDFPLGIAYISASLKKAGFDVHCLNLNHHENPEQALSDSITAKNIDILCTGGLSVHFDKIESILSFAKTINPRLVTIVGGGVITADPLAIFELLPMADYGVVGEGEVTIVELISAIIDKDDMCKVQGIIFRDASGKAVIAAPRNPIEDLDAIGMPDYEGFEAEKYISFQTPSDNYDFFVFDKPRSLPIISSRSCPFKCTFCFHPLGDKYRQRSLESFFSELDYLIENYSINYAYVYDELFSNDKKRISAFCEQMKKRNIKWLTQLRVDMVDEEMLALLKDSGLLVVSYGIESADPTILKSMKKKININQVEKALSITRKMQICPTGNLIFGDTEETKETAHRSIEWFKNNLEYLLGIFLIDVYPGTALYLSAIKEGIIKNKAAFLRNPGNFNTHLLALRTPGSIKLSRMSDREYDSLIYNLWKMGHKSRLHNRAKIISLQFSHHDNIKGDIYSLATVCPWCKQENSYAWFEIRHLHFDPYKGVLVLCKHCHAKNVIFDQIIYASVMAKLPRFVYKWIIYFKTTKILKVFYKIKQRLLALVDKVQFWMTPRLLPDVAVFKVQPMGGIQALNFPEKVERKENFFIRAKVENLSPQDWHSDSEYPVRLCYHWKDNNNYIIYDGIRTDINNNILCSNNSLSQLIKVEAPDYYGKLSLELTIVQDGIQWFNDPLFTSDIIEVEIK